MKPGPYKLFILLAGFVVFIALIVIRLVDIQVMSHDYYSKIAVRQHGFVRAIPAKRGSILDRNLQPLAMTLPAYQVCADPSLIENPSMVARELVGVVPADLKNLITKLSDKESQFKMIERALDVESTLRLKALDLEGIYFEAASKRVRPPGSAGQNVIGCLSVDGQPLGGIELARDTDLRGRPGIRRYLRDALGNSRPCVGAILEKPVSGSSVVLTIDSDLQAYAEAALDEAVREHKAKGGCVVVIDPWCGDILALASSPRGQNFPVRTVFEPGSAFKICTFASALDLNKADTCDVFDTNNGVLKVPGGCIRDDHPREILNLVEAFAVSSNVVAAMLARRIGDWDFYRSMRAFGFGLKTGIELEGESAGILREPDDWCRRSLESLAFGQEIGVTAVQLTMAYATIANGGKLLRPRLVQAVVDEDGNVIRRYPAKTVRTVIREETSAEMIRLLESVVQGGTGVPASIDGLHVAGKTGTGQKAEGGRYIKGKLYSVFAGFVPSRDARYVCVVVVDEPTGWTQYGGWVAGPVFKGVMEWLLRREKDITPSNCIRLAAADRPEFPDDLATVSVSGVGLAGVPGKHRGDLYPSVIGLTLREAASVLARAGIGWRAQGSGRVMRQNPAAYAPLDETRICDLALELVK
jgi:cell division protein FtsI/penicillin-binding protein 2